MGHLGSDNSKLIARLRRIKVRRPPTQALEHVPIDHVSHTTVEVHQVGQSA